MSRGRSRRRRAAAGPAVPVAVGLCLGAAGGWLGAPWLVSHLGPPVPLDSREWTVLVPGRKEGIDGNAGMGGSGVVDGELVLVTRTFGRSDLLVPTGADAVGEVVIGLAPGSGTVVLNVRGETGEVRRAVELGPAGWRTSPGQPERALGDPGAVRIAFEPGGLVVDGVATGAVVSPGRIEIMAGTGTPRLTALRLSGPDGQVLRDAVFSGGDAPVATRAAAGAGAGVAGAVAGLLVSAGLGGVLELALAAVWPALVLLTPYETWRSLVERLYLVDATPSEVRTLVFALTLAPLLGAGLLASGVLGVPEPAPGATRRADAVGLGAAVLAGLVASRGLSGLGWLGVVPGVAFLCWPHVVARITGRPAAPLRDAPALVAVALGGWGYGLLPAACWRLLCLLADAPALARTAAQAGTWTFAVTGLAALVGVEATVRTSFLGTAWDPVTLAGASLDAVDQPQTAFAPFWSGECAGQGPQRTVYTFGGSSAGGAYQFRDEPEAFFPARLHALLCATGGSYVSRNYGESGRDSFDAARAAGALFAAAPPSVVIVYTGVNDLLTADHPYSRREMAERRAAMGATTTTLDAIGSSVRTITGLSLLLRPPQDSPSLVVAVPLEDAEVNLRAIIAAATERGGRVLLVPEYTVPNVAGMLKPYFDMERRLGETVPGATFVDSYPGLDAVGGTTLLADRNHLTREGCAKLAEVILPAVEVGLE